MIYNYIKNGFVFAQDILSQIAVFFLSIGLHALVSIIYESVDMGKIRAIYFYHKAVSFSLGIVALAFGFWQIISAVILVILMFYPDSLN